MRNKIVYAGRTFQDPDIKSGEVHLATSLLHQKLEANSFSAIVKSNDPTLTDFTRNTPLYYYYQDRLVMISYVQTVDRIGPDKYEIKGTSAIGRLLELPHRGGIYTGQTAKEVIADICGPVPSIVKSSLENVKLYGWLPYVSPPNSSARDNLVQVLFAIGATVKTDLDGVLRIEGLWDGVSGSVGRDKMYVGASTDYEGKITQVTVTEHQYVPWTEEKQLFEGTAQAGDIITFDDPMHTLTAEGFTILESGANWAKLSAGSGTLKGRTYIHNTRQISKQVSESESPNIKTIENATLISLTNSAVVAQRLADYYGCLERINTDAVYKWEIPGNRINSYHPFDKKDVFACLEIADISISNVLKAKETMLAGYVPTQTENMEYLNFREVLTGSGHWTIPEGVTSVRYVLFSGATGGSVGDNGGNSGSNKSHSYTDTSSNLSGSRRSVTHSYKLPGDGGKGGSGGEGGHGSRILEGTMSVTPGQKISYQCGIGGPGGTNGAGSEGTPTTFGSFSSASGTIPSDARWIDIIGEKIFASKGITGLPGGDGAGADPDYEYPDTSDTEKMMQYKPSTAALDHSGKSWPGATTKESKVKDHMWHPGADGLYWATTSDGYAGASAGYGLGPGGVVGVQQSQPTVRGYYRSTSATATDGITPPRPIKPEKAELTKGGYGGYGGGGASSPGWAGTIKDNNHSDASMSLSSGSAGVGGPGGYGGDGGDGMILLFYAKGEKIPSGQFLDKNGKQFIETFSRRVIT